MLEPPKVMTIGMSPAESRRLAEALPGWRFEHCQSGFEAGSLADGFRPECVVVDAGDSPGVGRSAAEAIAVHLWARSDAPDWPSLLLVAVADEVEPGRTVPGFATTFARDTLAELPGYLRSALEPPFGWPEERQTLDEEGRRALAELCERQRLDQERFLAGRCLCCDSKPCKRLKPKKKGR